MAGIAATLLDQAIINSREGFKKYEHRVPKGEVIKAFLDYKDEVVPTSVMEAAKVSKRRPATIPVIKRGTTTVGTARAINPTPDRAETALVTPTWSTKTFSIAISPSVVNDNMIGFTELFNQRVYDSLIDVFFKGTNALEKQLVTLLEASKYATPPASTVDGVVSDSGAYILTAEDFLIKAPVIMEELDMVGPFQDMGNVGSMGRQRDNATYGRMNSRDVSQYMKDLTYYYSKNIAVEGAYEESHYLTQPGSLALLNIIEFDARNRTAHASGVYDTYVDPIFGFEWGVRIVSDPSDQTSNYGAGQERAVEYRYDFAADFAPVIAYSSTSASPIVKMNVGTYVEA